MADELIGEAQPFSVEHAVFVQHHGVIEPATQGEAAFAQVLDLVHEAEGACAGDLLEIGGLGEIHFDRLRRALDHRVAEFDRERKLVALEGLEARPLVAVLHFHASHDPQESLRRGLLDDPGLLDQQNERRGAAVHDRQLGGVEVDIDVVDAEPAERGHQMLDGVDLHAVAHQARRQAGFADRFGARGNIDRRGQVDAPEHDAGFGRRRAQGEADFLSGVQADARSGDQRFQCALPQHR